MKTNKITGHCISTAFCNCCDWYIPLNTKPRKTKTFKAWAFKFKSGGWVAYPVRCANDVPCTITIDRKYLKKGK